jgi:predicted amidohydrolase YtcJ
MTSRADLIVQGRIATLTGAAGFGWVEAVAIADGRVLAAGSLAEIEATSRPGTRRLVLSPAEVAIPGLTDAHLHLAQAAMSAQQVDLTDEPTLERGLARIGAAHAALTDRAAWLLGHGWESDRWGGWPNADALERVAPGRAIALWAHDHHSLWASPAALARAGIGPGTRDPDGGEIRRDPDGSPTGVLHETATGIVAGRVPPPSADALVEAIPAIARELLALGVVAVHDPGDLVADSRLAGAFVAYGRLDEAGRLPLRIHACLRQEALDTAAERGLGSGMRLGSSPDGRARVGWQKLFADGSLGSRTAALLEPFTFEPGRPLGSGRDRGIFITEPAELAFLTARAAEVGIATQIHAIGDAALRAALDALEPQVGRQPLVPRVEHVQLVDPLDLPRFGRLGIAASVQPVHLRSDAAQARHLWGERAEPSSYRWRALSDSGALIPFGTDAPVERLDPWPGIAIAVTRADPSWPVGTAPFGPNEALTLARALRANCLDGPRSAGETDRGRLVEGYRADVAVLPAAAFEEPVRVGGPLATVRPRLVLMDGQTVYEA